MMNEAIASGPEAREHRKQRMREGWAACKVRLNHKVAEVRRTGGFEEVYDLSVEGFENFALSAGVFVHNCLLLRDFGPYLRHTIPTTPKAGLSRCLNNCRCTLKAIPASEEQIRVLDALAYSKQYYLKLLNLSRSRPDRGLPRKVGRQGPPPPRTRRRK
jgi:hypothetical protein